MARNLKIFDATIPFLGGKRKMAERIAKEFQGETLLDIFMGGGVISLKGKQRGMKVIANDIAYRSKIIGEALIKNQTEKITVEDVYSLFLPSENDGFIEKNFVPKVFIPQVAKNLDNFFANARKRESPKKELLLLLLVKYILSLRQYGAFQVGRQDNEMILEEREEELLEIASESRGKKIVYNISHPLPLLMKLKDQINYGVFNSGKENEVYQMDCFELLEMLKDEGRKVSILYSDSVYRGCTVYSSHYRVLDQILEQKMDLKIEDTEFNKTSAIKSFERLFSLANKVADKFVISLGYNPASDIGIRGEELLETVKKFKDADLYFMKHNWAINNIASKNGKRQSENVEYLIVTK